MTYTGLFLIVIAYLIGSLSFAVIISKLFKLQDPRTYGSHNPGATNVLRSGKKKAAAFTLLGDGLKGFIPVLLALLFARQMGLTQWDIAGISLAVLLGHMWPIYFKFQGGKGVATAIGLLFAISWPTAIGCLLVWLIIVGIFRISSLAALVASALSPLFSWYFVGPEAFKYTVVVIALLVLMRHHSNIKKLVSGQEHIFKKTDKKPK